MAISPCADTIEQRLTRADYLILGAFCLFLFGYTVVDGRRLTGHESVLPETAREMLANQDWLIPRMGGEPWLERPPLPSWIMAGMAACFGSGTSDRVARLGPVCLALGVVLLVAGTACRWYGRAVGLLSGLILATMWEFFSFASDPEADIFLCAIVTAALAIFARLEWPTTGQPAAEDVRFFGRRSRLVMAFFILLGMTNLAKGLIFGTLMVLIPVAGFLVWNADLRRLRHYCWFWGWLACLAVACAWPVAAFLHYPAILHHWKMHYLGRLYEGYIGEPVWYYLVTLPYVMLPWSLVAFAGLWWSRREAFCQRSAPARFLWCWALLVPAIFSIPNGKHHHYLLHALAPWAVFAALATRQLWQVIQARCREGVLLRMRDGRLAGASLFGLLLVGYLVGYTLQTRYDQSYQDDLVFLKEVRRLVPRDKPLLVHYDARAELETFWVLFYSNDGTAAFYDADELRQFRSKRKEIHVLARAYDYGELDSLGTAEMVLQSRHTRAEAFPGERRTLFRVRFDTH